MTDRVLGLIVARGGSKGVPGKNLRTLGGHPLVAYAVRASIRAPSITRTIISTDDQAIADTAARYGADVPFMRPAELAADTSPVLDTIRYTIERLEQDGDRYDMVCLLQPTAPLRAIEDIEQPIAILRGDDSIDSVVTLAAVVDAHPARLRRIENDRVVQFLESGGDVEGQQRQDHEAAYRRNGACYASRRDTIIGGSLTGTVIAPWVMPEWRSVNIDDETDLLMAEAMIVSESNRSYFGYLERLFDEPS